MPEIPLVMPKMSMTMEEGVLLVWHRAEGDEVRSGDVVCEVMTDKVDMEVESPVDGTLVRLVAQPDQVVAVGEPIAFLLGGEDDLLSGVLDAGPAETNSPRPARTPLTPVPARGPSPSSALASAVPLARRRAVELGVDLMALDGTGPGGTIRVVDVEASASPPKPLTVRAPEPPPAARLRSRRAVARRSGASAAVPQAVVFRDLDLEALAERRGRCGWTGLIVRAYAHALRDSPLNARWTGEGSEVWSDVSVALMVHTERGPVAPVLTDPDRLPVERLDELVRRVSGQARGGKVPVEHLTTATTTVHDLGDLGVDAFQELIDPPQATVLSVGAVAPHVVPVGGGVGLRTRCRVALTVDYRVGDCADAARLLNAVQQRLDDPGWFGWR